ncbi:HNH endonuclease [Clostridium beijerinckii]|uniref:HNH nuclease domain-containing protein n=1 Tax=Clostridium beijerinckii TaxID=1520 RepID=A0A1S9N994_CLOBE|nr:HNH endonuclease [Clostridium beijerinckii]OOP74117.1 hypothetical protein CBEIBR21_06360 [Clostridium beijerinckii]
MHEEYCNCALNWRVGGICHYYSNSIFNEAGELYDGKEEYFIIFKNYISNAQNDKVLLKFLKENYDGHYCCYFNIAIFLIKQIYGDYHETSDKDLEAFIISYLKWSYGLPYDENNKLRKNLKGVEIEKKCCCYPESWKSKICHTYIKNLIREDGTLYNKNDEIYIEMLKDYISMERNDRVLFDFIKENCEKYKMCYYDIAVFIMWKIYDHFDILMRKDIIIFMISYLYWSYGNPYDTDNILRKHFAKEEIKDYKCNCKECFGEKCYRRCDGFSLTDYYLKSKGVFGIRREWMGYALLYTDFIEPGKNDKTLREFLSRNYNGEFCYLKIAEWIVKKTKRHLYYVADNEEDLIDCIMSYLYWAYGAPYDEDHNALKVMIDMEKIRRKKRKEKADNRILKKQISNKVDIREKYKLCICKKRIGQGQLRKDALIYYDGKCLMCGVDNEKLLNTSHIQTFAKSEKKKSRNIYNVLLLCDKHDGLFNDGLISFNDDGKIIISSELDEKNRKELQLEEDMIIELELEHKEFLKWHRENVFIK